MNILHNFHSTRFTYFYEYVHINWYFLISVHVDPEEEGTMLPQNVIKRLPHNTVSSQTTALSYYLIFDHKWFQLSRYFYALRNFVSLRVIANPQTTLATINDTSVSLKTSNFM